MKTNNEKRDVCVSDAIFSGMSFEELAKTLSNIHIDPNYGLMPRAEQEIGYRAIGEAIKRLKTAEDAIHHVCKTEASIVNIVKKCRE